MIEPFILDQWNNEIPVASLVKTADNGGKIPHILLLSGRKDNVISNWHMDHLWGQFQKGSNTAHKRYAHHFDDGHHLVHEQFGYHERIKKFINEVFTEEGIPK